MMASCLSCRISFFLVLILSRQSDIHITVENKSRPTQRCQAYITWNHRRVGRSVSCLHIFSCLDFVFVVVLSCLAVVLPCVCIALSCLVSSCRALSYLVVLCLILSLFLSLSLPLSCLVLSCLSLSCGCLVLSCLVVVLFCGSLVLWFCLVLSCLVVVLSGGCLGW
jgi:hypothetical protein